MSRVAPVNTPAREVHNGDLPLRTLDAIGDPADREDVITNTENIGSKDYLEQLAFMEEDVTVMLNRGREKHAPRYEQFGVNGKLIWIETGTPTRIKRKYLEVMARSQPMSVQTHSGEDKGDALTFNTTERSLSSNFSFSVIGDTAKGSAWLAKVMRES